MKQLDCEEMSVFYSSFSALMVFISAVRLIYNWNITAVYSGCREPLIYTFQVNNEVWLIKSKMNHNHFSYLLFSTHCVLSDACAVFFLGDFICREDPDLKRILL